MKRILIVGEKFSAFTDYLTDHGYDFIVLKDVAHTKYPDKKFKRRVLCDFSTKESVLTAVKGIKKPIDGVVATYESYILPTSWITQELKLPGISPASAEACTDKFLMRTLFAKAPIAISPDFAIVKNEETLREFAATHDFPLILKPTNLAKSLLVTKNHNLAELLANYEQAMQHIGAIYKKYAPTRTPTLLVEEFLEGSIHSVDAFTGTDGVPHVLEQIVDYQTGYDIGFDDNFHYSRLLPSTLSPAKKQALRECVVAGIKALGITSAPSHAEVIMTKKGPRIVEIGARNGGYRERMHRLADGIDIPGAALSLAMGTPPHITATKSEQCAVLELFPKTPGIFTGIQHKAELQALPSLCYFNLKVKPGAHVDKAASGHKMCAVVILHHSDPKQFARDLTFVNDHVCVQTKKA